MTSPRYWTVVLLLLATAIMLHSRGDVDQVPASEPLSKMPQTIGAWTNTRDIPLDDEVLAILGKGDFLNRVYASRSGGSTVAPAEPVNSTAPISLFIGYFPTQRTGQSIHSPQNCLPGSGWTFESQKYVELTAQNGKPYRVGEYVISDGNSRQFVLYWYQAHGRSIPNEYVARAYMIADAIRLNRTDGALVRVISPILPTEPVNAARDRVVAFTSQLAPILPRFIPD
ncbi:exosortase C-terminal domain/associated protein EpsI [Edaphobacter bradus]|uniref:exosortase C-terminal domain/associated protein EpsI n=1 Tax=Edaphobacter bradus TaxID=2259016 RepID=UPI0021DFA2E7|nr:exosortase C-terminal domain/associated protein EpsI [Edaphobacter bradus]